MGCEPLVERAILARVVARAVRGSEVSQIIRATEMARDDMVWTVRAWHPTQVTDRAVLSQHSRA